MARLFARVSIAARLASPQSERRNDMSNRKLLPGKFVWFELVSRDAKKAQAFYGEVLGRGAVRRAFLKVEMMIGGINFVPSDVTRTARQALNVHQYSYWADLKI